MPSTVVVPFVVLALFAAPPAGEKKPAAKPKLTAKKSAAAAKPAVAKLEPEAPLAFEDSPDGAVRGLLVALAERDPAALRAVTLPLPPADVKLLLGGAPVPAAERGKALPLIAGCRCARCRPARRSTSGRRAGSSSRRRGWWVRAAPSSCRSTSRRRSRYAG
jgi:hypothetical protein